MNFIIIATITFLSLITISYLLQAGVLLVAGRLLKITTFNYRDAIKITFFILVAQLILIIVFFMVLTAMSTTIPASAIDWELIFSIFAISLLAISFSILHFFFKKDFHTQLKRSLGIFLIYTILVFFVSYPVEFLLIEPVRTYVMSAFQVFGPTMCDTLNNINGVCQKGFGEYFIINKIVYRIDQPARGDIIVFRPPHNPTYFYVKRIIGLPGETINIENGRVYIINKEYPNEVELNEPYLNAENQGKTFPYSITDTKEYKIPEGMYFMLGDNRRSSADSRSCFQALSSSICEGDKFFLDRKLIEGKAAVVLWPFNKIRLLENPFTD